MKKLIATLGLAALASLYAFGVAAGAAETVDYGPIPRFELVGGCDIRFDPPTYIQVNLVNETDGVQTEKLVGYTPDADHWVYVNVQDLFGTDHGTIWSDRWSLGTGDTAHISYDCREGAVTLTPSCDGWTVSWSEFPADNVRITSLASYQDGSTASGSTDTLTQESGTGTISNPVHGTQGVSIHATWGDGLTADIGTTLECPELVPNTPPATQPPAPIVPVTAPVPVLPGDDLPNTGAALDITGIVGGLIVAGGAALWAYGRRSKWAA